MASRSDRDEYRAYGDDWCEFSAKFSPVDILAAVAALESSEDVSGGSRAKNRRDARAVAALLAFSELRVLDCCELLGLTRHAAHNSRKKWLALPAAARAKFLRVVGAQLEKR